MWNISDKKDNYSETYACSEGLFTKGECELIIKQGLELQKQVGQTFDVDPNKPEPDKTIRNNSVAWINPENKDTLWIYERIMLALKEANDSIFNYALTWGEDFQFTIYDEVDNHYTRHMDSGVYGDAATRKLTFSLQLSDPEYYEGSRLLLHTQHKPIEANIIQGTINFFPSYILHEVTPLTSGKRYAVVGWIHGPKFR